MQASNRPLGLVAHDPENIDENERQTMIPRPDDAMPNEKRHVVRIVDALREKIASNELAPGTKLVEQEFARDFDVSRAVIRSAFAALEQRGLVNRIKNRGAYVAKYDFDQILRLWEIREVLTTMGYRLAARHAPDGGWDSMIERFGAAMEPVVADKDARAFSDAIIELDRLVAHYAGNEFLEPILEPIIDLTQVVLNRRMMILPGRMELALEHNRRLLQALAARDEAAAAECYGEMMSVSRDYLTKYRDVLF